MKYLFFSLFFLSSLSAHEYRAKIVDVTDGDTVTALVDLGLDVTKLEKVRLSGIDAPELNTEAGKRSRDFLEKRIKHRTLILITEQDRREKYGRLLAEIILENQSINEMLVKHGFAKEYDGGKR